MNSAVQNASSSPVADKQKLDECWRAAALAAQRSAADADSEVSDFEPQIDEKDKRGNLFFETRISDAERLKARGNELFKNGEFRRALRRYRKGLYYSHFDELQLNFELQDVHREAVARVDHPLRLNASACLLQLQRYAEAEEMVSEILTKDKRHVKALYRRCHARLGRCDYDGAEEDAQQMLNAEPGNQAASELLNEVCGLKRKHLSDLRKTWKGKLALASASGGDALTAYANASQAYHDLNAFDASVEEREKNSAVKSRLLPPAVDCSPGTSNAAPTPSSTRASTPHKPSVTCVPPPFPLPCAVFALFCFVCSILHRSTVLIRRQIPRRSPGKVCVGCHVVARVAIAALSRRSLGITKLW
jgi:tetratricopeptide (TPR) repeat protein